MSSIANSVIQYKLSDNSYNKEKVNLYASMYGGCSFTNIKPTKKTKKIANNFKSYLLLFITLVNSCKNLYLKDSNVKTKSARESFLLHLLADQALH